jgi:UDP-2,3-diacylglucosamine hydrolase
LKKISHSLVFVSDVHILEADDDNSQALIKLIGHLDEVSVEYFVLGGDIFDFCFGASKYFKSKFSQLGQALESAHDRGIKIIFMQGNHEFSLDRIGWRGIDFVTGLDREFQLADGTRFAVTHGDRFFVDWSYRFYIAVTRSTIFRLLALLVPQKKLNKFALFCSRTSREKGESRKLVHEHVLTKGSKWLSKTKSQYGLFGHFHFPYQENIGEKMLLSVKCWHKPNFLAYDAGSFSRYVLNINRDDSVWVEED